MATMVLKPPCFGYHGLLIISLVLASIVLEKNLSPCSGYHEPQSSLWSWLPYIVLQIPPCPGYHQRSTIHLPDLVLATLFTGTVPLVLATLWYKAHLPVSQVALHHLPLPPRAVILG